jgi:hypothetical protein
MDLPGETESPIESWSYRWLADSSGVAFLERVGEGNQRLMVADLKSKKVVPLTSATEDVQVFDARDQNHYVYTAAALETGSETAQAEAQSPIVVATGRSILDAAGSR